MNFKKIIKLLLFIICLVVTPLVVILEDIWAILLLAFVVEIYGAIFLIDTIFKTSSAPRPLPDPPVPTEVEKPTFNYRCSKCGKEFKDETKLRRHFGMAHYDLIKI